MELRDKILELRAQGKSYNQIQALLGCSRGTISYHLGEGQKDKTNQRSARNRDLNMKKFHEYKEMMGCFDCGQKFPHYVLEFDHRPEHEKTAGVYKVLVRNGITAAWEEIAKCDVVCANCHKIRTYMRNPWGKTS